LEKIFSENRRGDFFDSHCTFELRDFADLEAKKVPTTVKRMKIDNHRPVLSATFSVIYGSHRYYWAFFH